MSGWEVFDFGKDGSEEGTTEDGLFTLLTVACIGCCSLAPVIMINDDTHGNLSAAMVRKLLKKVRRNERKKAKASAGGR